MFCYIPSKNRPNTRTYQLFESAGIEVRHFIEPSEMEVYEVPGKVDILQNERGIAYVRNFMLNYAKQHDHKWIICCDDDVTFFGKYEGGTKVKTDASIWLEIFERVRDLPYEIIGINYVQHAWYAQRDHSINSKFTEVCVLLNTSRIHWKYRTEFNTKEDRDFLLQAIKDGETGVLRFNRFFFSCPGIGKNAGGLQDQYIQRRDEKAAMAMCEEWKDYVMLTRKNNRVDIKVDLKSLALNYGKEVGSFFL